MERNDESNLNVIFLGTYLDEGALQYITGLKQMTSYTNTSSYVSVFGSYSLGSPYISFGAIEENFPLVSCA